MRLGRVSGFVILLFLSATVLLVVYIFTANHSNNNTSITLKSGSTAVDESINSLNLRKHSISKETSSAAVDDADIKINQQSQQQLPSIAKNPPYQLSGFQHPATVDEYLVESMLKKKVNDIDSLESAPSSKKSIVKSEDRYNEMTDFFSAVEEKHNQNVKHTAKLPPLNKKQKHMKSHKQSPLNKQHPEQYQLPSIPLPPQISKTSPTSVMELLRADINGKDQNNDLDEILTRDHVEDAPLINIRSDPTVEPTAEPTMTPHHSPIKAKMKSAHEAVTVKDPTMNQHTKTSHSSDSLDEFSEFILTTPHLEDVPMPENMNTEPSAEPTAEPTAQPTEISAPVTSDRQGEMHGETDMASFFDVKESDREIPVKKLQRSMLASLLLNRVHKFDEDATIVPTDEPTPPPTAAPTDQPLDESAAFDLSAHSATRFGTSIKSLRSFIGLLHRFGVIAQVAEQF